jgi:hypothetical protein
MLKEAAEIVRVVLEFFRSLKLVFTIFLCSAIWLLPPVRNLFPVSKAFTDNANFIASIILLLSGAYLMVSVFLLLYHRVQKWRRSEERRLRKALEHASPLEKSVLEAVICKGQYLIGLDVGSPIAMHLQELGLIIRVMGPTPCTMYQLAIGLADFCIRTPSLLHVQEQQTETALVTLEQWRNEGLHNGFFNQLRETGS